jgi:trehalose 6-phosphate phosphatase
MRPNEGDDLVGPVVQRALTVLRERPSGLISDIDGTLSRIAERPDEAYVSDRARSALTRLRNRLDLVGVITARPKDVAQQMVRVEGLEYIGSYALRTGPSDEGANLTAAREIVPSILMRFPGVNFEEKGISFALHYRGCEEPERVRAGLLELIYPATKTAGGKILEGKRVLEIVPASLPDKGTAFSILMLEHGITGAIFMGDDHSDIAVFQEIHRRRQQGLPGLGVGVVDEETEGALFATADQTLAGVDAVEEFLERLAGAMENGGTL